MIHTSIYRASFRLMLWLGVVMSFFIGLWVFSVYSWIYKTKPDYSQMYATMIPEPQVFGASQQVVVAEAQVEEQNLDDPRNTELFDKKVAEVKRFLDSYKAPLAAHAEDFVRAAEMYNIDYRLLPSISIVESSGGKHLFKKFNPFGWGSWGYPNFTVAIYDVARGMSRYYAGGRVSPEAISKRYNPVTPESWASKVRKLTGKMAAL